MPRVCTVCSHAKRTEIDRALVDGASNRALARQHAISHDAIRRHRAHVPARVAKAAQVTELAEAVSLSDRMDLLTCEAFNLLDQAKAVGDLRSAAALIEAARKTLETLMRLTGELRPGSQVNIAIALMQSDEWRSLRERIVTVLDDFPEARAAVLHAIAAGGDIR
jgi:hypothetical protein